MTENSRLILCFIIPWLGITIGCWILVPWLHASAVYFTKAYSVLAGIVLSLLYLAKIKSISLKPASINISLSAIGLKLFGSTAIFLNYFFEHRQDPAIPLLTGFSIYIAFTIHIALYGYARNIGHKKGVSNNTVTKV